MPYLESHANDTPLLPYGFQNRAKIFKPWMVLPERQNGFDNKDSYACDMAIVRYEPSKLLINAFNLVPSCRFKRAWKNNRATDVLVSEAWGTDSHKLVPSEDHTGKRLLIRKTDCLKFLKTKDKKLVYVLKVERYGSYKEWEEKETLRLGLIILVDSDSNVRTWKIKLPKPRLR